MKDEADSTWKGMQLGLVFCYKYGIERRSGGLLIAKEEYVLYFGNVQEFKKLLFAAAARAGYGKIKKVVVIGDGALWIWNMCEELFPDAIRILDFYHMSENTNNYGKILYRGERMKQSGMRWGIHGGQCIAALRAKYESKLWDKVVHFIAA